MGPDPRLQDGSARALRVVRLPARACARTSERLCSSSRLDGLVAQPEAYRATNCFILATHSSGAMKAIP